MGGVSLFVESFLIELEAIIIKLDNWTGSSILFLVYKRLYRVESIRAESPENKIISLCITGRRRILKSQAISCNDKVNQFCLYLYTAFVYCTYIIGISRDINLTGCQHQRAIYQPSCRKMTRCTQNSQPSRGSKYSISDNISKQHRLIM